MNAKQCRYFNLLKNIKLTGKQQTTSQKEICLNSYAYTYFKCSAKLFQLTLRANSADGGATETV